MLITAEVKKIIIDVALADYSQGGFVNRQEFKKDIYNIFIIRKMIKRYVHFGVINEKLVLNNVIISCNTFSQHKLEFIFSTILTPEELSAIKPFFNKISEDFFPNVSSNQYIIDLLSNIVYRNHV